MGTSITRVIENAISRRAFMVRATTVAGAFIAGLIGMPKYAYACVCCGLCRNPQQCTWNPAICDCVWCWVCKTVDCFQYKCKECLKVPYLNNCNQAEPCKCHSDDHRDKCRYCTPDVNSIPCSAVETLPRLPPALCGQQ